ncbi:MAG: hypothetical protein DWQ35_12530 [Planctomycetota bacterium]|nr:MAG: hypothetical protein DWQ35_12530 [Planctomycetota bacterium]REK24702.1 MAG: hypothetical protein DWQ42_13315 [Planctomycetota bacterium]REK40201.1 MAG: hypothetical protein DWQ46_17240 [Planctomycetota bacterium]
MRLHMKPESKTGWGRIPRQTNFTFWLALGLILGVGWGLFFGEYGAWIQWIGNAFVRLLQMTVLPYVVLSLTCNIGRLSMTQGGRIARVSAAVMAVLWAIGLATLVLQFSFPAWDGGSFFTSAQVQNPVSQDWLDVFIPANPFWSLSNNFVPAVVVFSIGLGVALIPVPNKEVLFEKLDILTEGLSRLNKFVVRLSPIGIFAIVGSVAATLSWEDFRLLQGYLLVYGAAAVLVSYWVLPALIASVTPFTYRQVLSASRDAMITGFIVGNTFVVLPMVIEAVKKLMSQQQSDARGAPQVSEYTVELAYPFPDIGRIVCLLFIPFAAWFYGIEIDRATIPQLLGTGFLGAFVKPVVTIPALLDIAHIPADIFNLFIAVGVIASRLGDLMKVAHLFAFSIVASSILGGFFRIDVTKLAITVVVTIAMFVAATFGIRAYLEYSFQGDYTRDRLIVSRPLLGKPVESVLLEQSGPNPVPMEEGEDRLDRIRRRGVIRIGIDKHKLPFSFLDKNGQLVGFDIDMAHDLALDLGVRIEFVPLTSDIIAPLRADHFDIAMSGLHPTLDRAIELPKMESYMEVTRAFVVSDYRRHQFRSLRRLSQTLPEDGVLKVAVVAGTLQGELVGSSRGLGTGIAAIEASGLKDHLEIVELESKAEFFNSEAPVADVLASSLEEGSAWTSKYPAYSVVRPEEVDARTPLYYFVAEQSRFERLVNSWLEMNRVNGTREQLYDYWILGKDLQSPEPRWSILRNVLGWVK